MGHLRIKGPNLSHMSISVQIQVSETGSIKLQIGVDNAGASLVNEQKISAPPNKVNVIESKETKSVVNKESKNCLFIDSRYVRGKIYKLYYKNDLSIFYIGHTIKQLSKRMNGHRSETNKETKTSKLYESMRKLGMDNFVIELVEEYPCDNKLQLLEREQHYIELLKPSLNVYNSNKKNGASGLHCGSYAKTIIYELYNIDNPSDNYVGHTIQELSRRYGRHIGNAKKGNRAKLYKRMREVGIDKFEIKILTTYSCGDKREVLKYEQEWISKLSPSLNSLKAYCTEAEYFQKNVAYRMKNREKINATKAKPMTCTCGASVTYGHIDRHRAGVIHSQLTKFKQGEKSNVGAIIEGGYIKCICGLTYDHASFVTHMGSTIHNTLMEAINIMDSFKTISPAAIDKLNKKYPKRATNEMNGYYLCACGSHIKLRSGGKNFPSHFKTDLHNNFIKFANLLIKEDSPAKM